MLHGNSDLSKPVRRRQRQTLSCLPCRRLKVKCDRGHPCRHCVWSDRAASCQYTAFPRTKTPSSGVASSDEDQASVTCVSSQAPPNRSQPTVLLPKVKLENSVSSSESPTTTSSRTEEPAKITDPGTGESGWRSKFRGSTHWLSVSEQVIDYFTRCYADFQMNFFCLLCADSTWLQHFQ
jgi:Fungal Zn(2)-Cys(6) binuclear cluster domain